MTFNPATDVVEVYNGPACWQCGGPCATFKGSVHGWRCAACLEKYLAECAARADAADRSAREKLARKLSRNNNLMAVTGG